MLAAWHKVWSATIRHVAGGDDRVPNHDYAASADCAYARRVAPVNATLLWVANAWTEAVFGLDEGTASESLFVGWSILCAKSEFQSGGANGIVPVERQHHTPT